MLTRILVVLLTVFVAFNCFRAGHVASENGDTASAVLLMVIGAASLLIPLILKEEPNNT
jgi:hypothetical protein